MISEPLWESARNIVEKLREEIKENGADIHVKEEVFGWQYGKRVLQKIVKELEDDMEKRGYKVAGITVFHFLHLRQMRIVMNKSKRRILLPIEGSSTLEPDPEPEGATNLTPGGPLQRMVLYLINDQPYLLAGNEGVDIIIIALEENESDNS